jgi:preprotein translocase subunit SecB
MSDEGNVISDLDLGPVPNGEDTLPSAGILAQYVKDLSVENPNAPESFQWQDPPQIDVQFNITATAVKTVITSKAQAGTAFVVDLSYCGLIGMRNIDPAQAHAFLYAEAPRILFPFARRIVADAVRDAGYPQLMLEPIDFNGLYVQQLSAQQQGDEGEPAGAA